ncbi:MAG: tRNA 2-thiouridine(34) synthase MnmA, partial [Polyangiales bacterium]
NVIEPFLDEYRAGRTPSPCVHCNRTVKISHLVALADRFGATAVATGHYARIETDLSGGVRLLRGRDLEKDQSYFLFGVPSASLRRLRTPLGHLDKAAVRSEGRRLGIPNADKPDSQELCFVPDGDIRGFVERERGAQPAGDIVDAAGGVLGEHDGIAGFTVGQRRGLKLGGGPPRYVLRIVPDENRVVVGDEGDLAAPGLRARDVQWVHGRPSERFQASVRIRYRHEPAPAWVTPTDAGFDVEFDEPQRAVTPGQATVVYQHDEVVAGGFIEA